MNTRNLSVLTILIVLCFGAALFGRKKTIGNEARGLKLYEEHCLACHQKGGLGKPGFAPSIRNRDFLAIASDEFIKETITKGRPMTSMIPRKFTDEQLNDMIAYLRALPIANPVRVRVDPYKKVTGDADNGEELYGVYCASCHGPKGEGYRNGGSGPAIGLKGFLDVANDDYIYQTIRLGRVGTPMQSFMGSRGLANLTRTEVYDIIVYLRENAH